MYFVIHSTDPYLLARMCTDLQMQGWEYLKHWENDTPFKNDCKWVAIWGGEYHKDFYFLNHNGVAPDARFTLTSKNYLKVLGTILESKKR